VGTSDRVKTTKNTNKHTHSPSTAGGSHYIPKAINTKVKSFVQALQENLEKENGKAPGTALSNAPSALTSPASSVKTKREIELEEANEELNQQLEELNKQQQEQLANHSTNQSIWQQEKRLLEQAQLETAMATNARFAEMNDILLTMKTTIEKLNTEVVYLRELDNDGPRRKCPDNGTTPAQFHTPTPPSPSRSTMSPPSSHNLFAQEQPQPAPNINQTQMDVAQRTGSTTGDQC
jgi:hypothetical protein